MNKLDDKNDDGEHSLPTLIDFELEEDQEEGSDEEDEEAESDCDKFKLSKKCERAVAAARNIARRLLRQPSVTPQDVIALGKALYALERMPLSTTGVDCSFGVELRCGDSDNSQREYMSFEITDSFFEITRGGSVYESSVGSDSFSLPGCLIEVGGYSCCDCEPGELEDAVSNYIASRCKIEISDNSDEDFKIE